MCSSKYLVALVGLAVPILGQTVSTDPSGATFLGCWTDSSNRLLNGSFAQPSDNTIESCHASCAGQSFDYFGVEYSDECYCGNVLVAGNSRAASDSDCNYPCSGNNTEICGGSWRISLYQLSGVSSASASAVSSTSSPAQQSSSSFIPSDAGSSSNQPTSAVLSTSSSAHQPSSSFISFTAGSSSKKPTSAPVTASKSSITTRPSSSMTSITTTKSKSTIISSHVQSSSHSASSKTHSASSKTHSASSKTHSTSSKTQSASSKTHSASSRTSKTPNRLPTQSASSGAQSTSDVCKRRKAEEARLAKVIDALKTAHEPIGSYLTGEWSALVQDSPQTQKHTLAQINDLDREGMTLPPYLEGYLAAFRKVGETEVVNC